MKNLSFVICSKSDSAGLNRTLQSLIHKDLQSIPKILVLSGYQDWEISHFKQVLSNQVSDIYKIEPNGVFFAQNFGLMKVKTDFVLFLNGGDELLDLDALQELLSKMEDSEWGYGLLQVISPKGKTKHYGFKYNRLLHRLGLKYVPHPSSVLKVQTAISLGGYDENFRTAADHKLLLQLSNKSDPSCVFSPISRFYLGGISDRSTQEIVSTSKEISRDLFGYFGKSKWVDEAIWALVLLIRSIKF